ncbi:MAG: hypothetical protein JW786_03325 [Desulfobacterales bacterium]|nr:hypothetical protein [Desulfobacterales bacterium]
MAFKNNLYLKILFFLFILLITGCAGSQIGPHQKAAGPDTALITIYLETVGQCSGSVSFVLDELSLLAGEQWHDLNIQPVLIDSRAVAGKQLLVGLSNMPIGNYTQIRFRLTQIKIHNNIQDSSGEDRSIPLSYPLSVTLEEQDSTCLFVKWNLNDCLEENSRFNPRFSTSGQIESFTGDLLYVVCDDINTLYLMRTNKNNVVASIGLPNRLGQIRFDPHRLRLYVLSPGARCVYVLDCSDNRLIDRISLPLTLEPRFMDLSWNGDYLFITDTPSNRVLKIDLQTGIVDQHITFGYRPERIIYFEYFIDRGGKCKGDRWLAVSAPDSQQVYLLNADNLNVCNAIAAGLAPDGLLFLDGLLYITDRLSNMVNAYNLYENRLTARIRVGLEPLFLLSDQMGKIYVSNHGADSLSVVIPGQQTALNEIPIGRSPFAMARSQRRQIIYTANRELKKITIMDRNADKILSIAELGGKPFFLDIWE